MLTIIGAEKVVTINDPAADVAATLFRKSPQNYTVEIIFRSGARCQVGFAGENREDQCDCVVKAIHEAMGADPMSHTLVPVREPDDETDPV